MIKHFEDVGLPITKPIKIMEDNQGTISVSNHNAPSGRTRHMDREDFASQEWVKRGLVIFEKIHTSVNPSDAMTKLLYKILIQQHFNQIYGKNGNTYANHTKWLPNQYDRKDSK